jgi:hypothetical protein
MEPSRYPPDIVENKMLISPSREPVLSARCGRAGPREAVAIPRLIKEAKYAMV